MKYLYLLITLVFLFSRSAAAEPTSVVALPITTEVDGVSSIRLEMLTAQARKGIINVIGDLETFAVMDNDKMMKVLRDCEEATCKLSIATMLGSNFSFE